VLAAIDLASGVAYNNAGTITANTSQTLSNITAGAITLRTSTGADLSVTGKGRLPQGFRADRLGRCRPDHRFRPRAQPARRRWAT